MPDPGVSFNPFPGLRPFDTADRPVFFGREEQTVELARRLRISRFMAVVGTSGSGKSSLVRAGLIPALHGGLMTGVGTDWTMAVQRPGGDPTGALAQSLIETGRFTSGENAAARLHATLARSAFGLIEAVRLSSLSDSENLLIVVDQFEEVFRFRDRFRTLEEESGAWVRALIEASRQRERPIFVMLTMRSDYLGDCAQFPNLPEAINQGEYLVPRMKREQYRIAIEGPVRVAGGRIAGRLVQRLLNDLGNDPDQLPVLQHALMRTWDEWRRDPDGDEQMDLRHYEAIGTMAEALSRHAEEACQEAQGEREAVLTERLFKALTELGPDNRGVRRPTRLRELRDILEATSAQLTPLIERFRQPGRTFLTPPLPPREPGGPEADPDQEPPTEAAAPGADQVTSEAIPMQGSPIQGSHEIEADTVVDISHESLMRIWKRLDNWVADESRSASIYRRLAESARLHAEGREGFLRDPALQVALDWRHGARANRAWGERYAPGFDRAMAFLEASRIARDTEERSRRRRRAILLASISTVTAVILLLSVYALLQRADALSRWRANQAEEALSTRSDEALGFAAEAVRQSPTDAAVVALRRTLFAAPLVRSDWEPLTGQVSQVAFSPIDSSLLVGAGAHASVLDAFTAKPPQLLPGHTSQVWAVAFTPDGSRAMTAGWDRRCFIWSTAGPAWSVKLALPDQSAPITDAAFSSDGTHGLITCAKLALVWSAATGQEEARIRPVLRDGDEVRCGAFSEDGLLVALGAKDGSLSVWRWSTRQRLWETQFTDGTAVSDVRFARQGLDLVTAGTDGQLIHWSPVEESSPLTWRQTATLSAHSTNLPVTSLQFSPDGGLLLSGGDDGQSILWHWDSGTPLRANRHPHSVKAVAFHPVKPLIMTGTFDGGTSTNGTSHLYLWDSGARAIPTNLNPPGLRWVAFASTMTNAALGHGDGRLRVFHPLQLTTITDLDDPSRRFEAGAFHPITGELITVGSSNNVPELLVRRPGDWALLNRVTLARPARALAIHASGEWLAITHDRSISLWDARAWTFHTNLFAPTNLVENIGNVTFSLDRRWLAATVKFQVVLWDMRTWELQSQNANDVFRHPREARALAIHPRDSGRLVTASYLDGLRWYSRTNGQWRYQLLPLPSDGNWNRLQSVEYSPDGGCVVSTDSFGRVVLRDEMTHKVIGEIPVGQRTERRLAKFTPDGRALWVFGPVGVVWESKAWAPPEGPSGLFEEVRRRTRQLRRLPETEWAR